MNSFEMKGKTDVHYRAAYHYASWNWRLVFDINVDNNQMGEYELEFFIYDRDLLSQNDYICHRSINIFDLVSEVLENENRIQKIGYDSKTGRDEIKFPIEMELNEDFKDKKKPTLYASLDILTQKEAKLSPAG